MLFNILDAVCSIYEWVERKCFAFINAIFKKLYKFILITIYGIVLIIIPAGGLLLDVIYYKVKEFREYPFITFTKFYVSSIISVLESIFLYLGLTYQNKYSFLSLLCAIVLFGTCITEILLDINKEISKDEIETNKNKETIISIYWEVLINIFMATIGYKILSLIFISNFNLFIISFVITFTLKKISSKLYIAMSK